MPAQSHTSTLMIQGTTSDAGKTTLVAGICRVLHRRGNAVAPFKPQNMALNSAVTIDGGEIGRAQALQAIAAGLEPHTDFNPVLLKPSSDTGAQVIIHGRTIDNMSAVGYHQYKTTAMSAVLDSWHRLEERYDYLIAEGAGSPAEINLRDRDIANMGFAEQVDCPVILIADIDRGGVFAHLVGTLELLSESERALVKGFVINRFRGDLALLEPGLEWLTKRTGIPVIGVLPYLQGLNLDAEDSLLMNQSLAANQGFRAIVPALPHISNHTDFDPLRLHPEVDFTYVGPDGLQSAGAADLVILPGSKNVIDDLAWLLEQGWGQYLDRHLRYGGKLIGICGGLQMLGSTICDLQSVESLKTAASGLGYLDLATEMKPAKSLRHSSGTLFGTTPVSGYEIHHGSSSGPAFNRPIIQTPNGNEGTMSEDGQIIATYWHGLFDSAEACDALLGWAGLISDHRSPDLAILRQESLNRLADCIEAHLDWSLLDELLGLH